MIWKSSEYQNTIAAGKLNILLVFYLIEEGLTHSSTLAWKIPWMEEPGRLQSMGSRRVGHSWATSLSLFTFMHWRRKRQRTPVFLPGESQGQWSLVGCSPWGREESDTAEWLHFHFSLSCIGEGNGRPLQCSCLENPRDSRAWWDAVYGVAQSRTPLKRLSSNSSSTLEGWLDTFILTVVFTFIEVWPWYSYWWNGYLKSCWSLSTQLPYLFSL